MAEQADGFRDLLVIRAMLQAARQLPESSAVDAVVRSARTLSHWLPLSLSQVGIFASKAQDLPPYIRDLVPAVIVAAARALSAHAQSPSLDAHVAQAAKRELEQVKHFAIALNKSAPAISLPVSLMQELNALH